LPLVLIGLKKNGESQQIFVSFKYLLQQAEITKENLKVSKLVIKLTFNLIGSKAPADLFKTYIGIFRTSGI